MKHENSLAIQWLGFGTFTASSSARFTARFNPWSGNYDPANCVVCHPPPKKTMKEKTSIKFEISLFQI